MHVIEAALVANLDSAQRKAAGGAAEFDRSVRLAPVLRRTLAFVATVGIVVIALQVAAAGASIFNGGEQVASIAIAG